MVNISDDEVPSVNPRLDAMGEMLKQIAGLEERLTEAKELLNEFVEWANWQGSNCPSFKSIQDKAEQFLNSEVEK